LKEVLDKLKSKIRGVLREPREVRAEIRLSLDFDKSRGILRRYFVMNAFDGALTSLGVVFGAYTHNIIDPKVIVGVILSTSLAMAVSGISGAYMTEKAEREYELEELEEAILIDLGDTIFSKAVSWISIFAAIVDGLAPFSASMVCIAPFLFVMVGLLSVWQAFSISTTLIFTTLFTLGIFLGKLSKKSILFSGLKMVIAGATVSLLSLLLQALPV
jgi:predicted membrane protein (TIGR00267 family)